MSAPVFCVNCRHYSEDSRRDTTAQREYTFIVSPLCKRPGLPLDLVGGYVYSAIDARSERYNEKPESCGRDAKYYEHKR